MLLLQKYYERRREGFIIPTQKDFDGNVSEEDILNCSDQLGQLGLIEWKALRGKGRLVAGMGRITAHGIGVIEGTHKTAVKLDAYTKDNHIGDPNVSGYKFDVAISFAGEDRAFAEAVANGLRDAGIMVFYDNFYASDLWGKDLSVELRTVYHHKSQFCIMIISQHYLDKMWTVFEGKQAIERMIKKKGNDYILPVRLDGFAGEVPGLSGSIGYLSVRSDEPQTLVKNFVEKINKTSKDERLRVEAPEIADRIVGEEKANQQMDQSRPICVLVRPPGFEALAGC